MELTLGQLDFFRAVVRNAADPAKILLRVDLTGGVPESSVEMIAALVERLVDRHPALAMVIEAPNSPRQHPQSHSREEWLVEYASRGELDAASPAVEIDPFSGPAFLCRAWPSSSGFEADMLVSHYFVDKVGTELLRQDSLAFRSGEEMKPPVGIPEMLDNERSEDGRRRLSVNAEYCNSQLQSVDGAWLVRGLEGMGSEGFLADSSLPTSLTRASRASGQPIGSVLLLGFAIAMLPECSFGRAMIKSLYGGSPLRRQHVSPYCFNAYVGFDLFPEQSIAEHLAAITRSSLMAYRHAWYDPDEIEVLRRRRAADLGSTQMYGDVYFNYLSPVQPGERHDIPRTKTVRRNLLEQPLPYRASLDVIGSDDGVELVVRGAGWSHYSDALECVTATAAALERLATLDPSEPVASVLPRYTN